MLPGTVATMSVELMIYLVLHDCT